METELTCAVCSDIYLEGTREPVTLPECGHTFCRQCLLNVEKSGYINCPYCRTKHHGLPIAEMSTVYAILNLTKFMKRTKFGLCKLHDTALDFWCQTCFRGLCGFCLFEGHVKNNHQVVVMKNAMNEKKMDIQNAGLQQLEHINDDKIHVMNEIHDCLARVANLCDDARALTYSIKEIKEHMGGAYDSFNMEFIINTLNKMEKYKPRVKQEMGNCMNSSLALPDSQGSYDPNASQNKTTRNRDDSTEDSLHPKSSNRDSESSPRTHDDSESSAPSSDADNDEGRNLLSEAGAAACTHGITVDAGRQKTAMRNHRIIYRRTGSDARPDHVSTSPIPDAVLRRNHSGGELSDGSTTSDNNANGLASHNPIAGTSTDSANLADNQRVVISRIHQNDISALEEGTDAAATAGWLEWSARGSDGREGRFRWEDGRLHLYTLTDQTQDVYGSIKLPVVLSLLPNNAEVFMDIGADGKCLGRVYIRVWGDLRRGQHFLALCVGSLGPSYKGSRCSKVEGKDKPGECLRVNHYVTADGIITARGLMDGLEWSGEFSAVKKEGLVVSASGGKTEYDGCFDICTRGNPAKKFSCPFGEVVSGMSVVKAASRHDPIGDLTIMNTGVVVIDHTS